MPPLQPQVVPTIPADLPRLVDVWEAAVRATHHFLTEANIQFFRPLVEQGLPKVPHLLCVRDAAGQAAGFIGVSDTNIDMLFIHPDWRGKGLGRCLMNHAIHELGVTTVDVNEQNSQALGFYRRLGFVVVGRSPLDGLGKPFPVLHLRLEQAPPPFTPQPQP